MGASFVSFVHFFLENAFVSPSMYSVENGERSTLLVRAQPKEVSFLRRETCFLHPDSPTGFTPRCL